jgi:DNA replication and repair protein RecF
MLRDLRLRDFRCFDQLAFEPSPGLNLIIGPNAQGKTSLLEAACVLLRLQSPRSSSLIDVVRFNQPGFGLDGHWNDRHMQLKFTESLKAFALDSKPQSRSADYLAVARVCWISNDDMQLVRGPGSHRRRYLDFLGAQVVSNYLSHLRAYERALRSRNALLKAREAICADLQPRVAEALRLIANGSETLEISYKAGSPPDLAAALRASRDEEIRLRTTISGPHRDDIEILLEGRQAVSFASEGQQRSIALAMKLGQARRLEAFAGGSPLCLIDDVFGELDPDRRNNLLTALPTSAQKFVTATTLNWLESNEGASVFLLSDGKVVKKKG